AYEIRARVLNGLIAADRPAALHARLRMLDDEIEDALGAAHHLRGARQRSGLEGRLQQLAAAARWPQTIVGGDLHVVEGDFEDLLAADRGEREPRDAGPGRGQDHHAEIVAL